MKRTGSSFLIGLFVIVGILLAIFALGWLGEAQRYVRRYTTYAAFFTESVRGLYPSSTVAFQGIDVGHVQAIDVAPDPTYIMVTMKIYRPELVTPRTYARIDTTGIAGSAYINLAEAPAGDLPGAPLLDFPVRYPVIPTRPSQLNAILAATQSVVSQVQGVVAQGQLQSMLAETSKSVTEAGKLLEELQTQAAAAQLPQAAAATRQTIEDLDAQTRLLSTRIDAALANLNQASDTLDRLLGRLYQRPADLLQSRPQPERAQASSSDLGGTR